MPEIEPMNRRDPAYDRHVLFMELALAQAAAAALVGEVPIGAVVVIGDDVVGLASNGPIHRCDPTAHAEVLALREASRRVGNYRLPGATIYVTVEPCCMCVGAMMHARIARVVFGCNEPKSGALGGAHSLQSYPFDVVEGVCADRAAALLETFFQARRGA